MVRTLWDADDDDLGGVTGRSRTNDSLMLACFLSCGSLLAEQLIVNSDRNGFPQICHMIVEHFSPTLWGMLSPVQEYVSETLRRQIERSGYVHPIGRAKAFEKLFLRSIEALISSP